MNPKLFSIFLAGVGLGAAVAVIMTPKSGSQLRSEANELLSGGVKKVQDRIENTKAEITRQVRNIDLAVKKGLDAYRAANGGVTAV